jgi:hypothetical protein
MNIAARSDEASRRTIALRQTLVIDERYDKLSLLFGDKDPLSQRRLKGVE